jgi:NDP-sugar pyrophosphorylase family protein
LETKVLAGADSQFHAGILASYALIGLAITNFSAMMTETTRPSDSESMAAVLLVGGLGTRLQPLLPSTPKPLAPVGDVPFLELLVLQLQSQGIRRLVMCTGHRAEQIEEKFGDGRKWGVSIEYSREFQPLGTAGALKLAENFLKKTSDFLVLNGDSFLEFDFCEFLRLHRKHDAIATIAVHKVPDASRYGTVQVDPNDKVIAFCEKKNTGAPGLINGGVYLFNQKALQYLPDEPSSLEKDVFPRLLEHGVYAAEQEGMFIDIGTPEDYVRAQTLRDSLCHAAVDAESKRKSLERERLI